MTRVLVLAYYFPPLGGAGVQRTVKLLKHLPGLGYLPIVVTIPESVAVDWAPRDDSVASELPPETVVRRITSPQPAFSTGWRSRAERWLARPSAFSRWWVENAVRVGRELAAEADVVYASMSPFETAEAADRIAGHAGVPWVADLRDPWALDEWSVYLSALHRRLDERRMGEALSRAGAVILNTPEAERAFRQRLPKLASRLATVPNGWDEEDFAAPPPARIDSAFRIVHVGYSHHAEDRSGWSARLRRLAGGTAQGVDHGARSEIYLVEAARQLLATAPDLARRIEIHLAGPAGSGHAGADLVRDHGYLSHAEAVTLVRSADLLFLPMHDLPPGVRARTVPGKTYEYLASGRPILAALPDGDARDLLTGLPNVRLCRPRDVAGMADALSQALRESPVETRVPDVALAYERRVLAARLVDVLDEVVGSSRPLRRPTGLITR